MVTVNGTTGVSMVQDSTITSAKIVDGSVAGTDLLTSNGIGYKVGDGGSVTQLTSKSTAVTLNKVSGFITSTSDAIAGSSGVVFTLTNSLIGARDVVIMNISSFNYRVFVTQISAGSCTVLIENRTAGSLAETLTINFAVIKAVGA